MKRRRLIVLLLIIVGLPIAFVTEEAIRTLFTLERVERERDTWQRPEEVLSALALRPGTTVLDLGSGAGYFSLKIAPRVMPGDVIAVDLRRESLAFLWIRARLRWQRNVRIIVGSETDPHLPDIPLDAALVANTLHEMAAPAPVLSTVFRSMHAGGRLVVLDRADRDTYREKTGHHSMSSDAADDLITGVGFRPIHRDDAFIDGAGEDDVWWLAVYMRP